MNSAARKKNGMASSRNLSVPAATCCATDDERNLLEDGQIGDCGEQHRVGDRNVQRHQHEQPEDKASRHEEVASPPAELSGVAIEHPPRQLDQQTEREANRHGRV